MIRSISYMLLCLLLLFGKEAQAQSELSIPKTFIFIRHAEKVQTLHADPPLTAAGTAQAMAFAEMLKEQPIAAIYSTPYRRTLETAAPLASLKKITTQLYEPLYAISLLEQLKTQADSGAVVVVGHSNTIPDMVNALAGREEVAPISEEEYGLVFIVVVPVMPGSAPSVVRVRLPDSREKNTSSSAK